VTSPVWEDERESYQRADGVTVISRRVFCRDYFDYKRGEHVVFGGPSTRGKTTLAFDLLEYIVNPDFPAYLAVSKPRDPVTQKRSKELNFRWVSEWPPPKKLGEMLGGQKPNGFVVAPSFGDLNTDMERCAVLTEKLLMERYANGANPKSKGGILLMDDTMIKAKIMGLDKPMITILAMAAAMGISEWVFVQKPTDSGRVTLWGFEMAIHLFLTKGGDARMLARYGEIIGEENGQLAKKIIPTLKDFQFLYVHKTEGTMCIVDAS